MIWRDVQRNSAGHHADEKRGAPNYDVVVLVRNSTGSLRLPIAALSRLAPTNEYRSGAGAHWPFLSDPRRLVQKDLDIAEYADAAHNGMIPHVIVLEPGLVRYKIYNRYRFFGRPTPEDLRRDLCVVTKKGRPDWDITKPELKTTW